MIWGIAIFCGSVKSGKRSLNHSSNRLTEVLHQLLGCRGFPYIIHSGIYGRHLSSSTRTGQYMNSSIDR